jgi:hypothetical protein
LIDFAMHIHVHYSWNRTIFLAGPKRRPSMNRIIPCFSAFSILFLAPLAVFGGAGGPGSMDFDGDGDVDLTNFAQFQLTLTGPVSSACSPRWADELFCPAPVVSAFETVVSAFETVVSAFETYDDGAGPALYIGGRFQIAGGQLVRNIVRWDGVDFSPLAGPSGVGVNNKVYSLQTYDDGMGDGPALYVGGDLSAAGGVRSQGIAKWYRLRGSCSE